MYLRRTHLVVLKGGGGGGGGYTSHHLCDELMFVNKISVLLEIYFGGGAGLGGWRFVFFLW